jgi:hypothetical protein
MNIMQYDCVALHVRTSGPARTCMLFYTRYHYNIMYGRKDTPGPATKPASPKAAPLKKRKAGHAASPADVSPPDRGLLPREANPDEDYDVRKATFKSMFTIGKNGARVFALCGDSLKFLPSAIDDWDIIFPEQEPPRFHSQSRSAPDVRIDTFFPEVDWKAIVQPPPPPPQPVTGIADLTATSNETVMAEMLQQMQTLMQQNRALQAKVSAAGEIDYTVPTPAIVPTTPPVPNQDLGYSLFI